MCWIYGLWRHTKCQKHWISPHVYIPLLFSFLITWTWNQSLWFSMLNKLTQSLPVWPTSFCSLNIIICWLTSKPVSFPVILFQIGKPKVYLLNTISLGDYLVIIMSNCVWHKYPFFCLLVKEYLSITGLKIWEIQGAVSSSFEILLYAFVMIKLQQ